MPIVETPPMPRATPASSESAKPHIPFPDTGSYPARTGNKLRPLIDGTPAFRRICEAIEAARHSVWVTITMMVPDFPMPDGRGSIFDVLDRAVARGLDVRVIFWRHDPESGSYQSFSGSPEEREVLRARGSRFRARWDRAHEAYCQHQKSWLVDAGRSTETAFVGGINPTRFAVSSPGHSGEGQFHDVYVELSGPSATDVHHNFVQRWNEASERNAPDGAWGHDGDDALAFPRRVSKPRGETLAQIQRTVHAGRYLDASASPGGRRCDIARGEQTIFEQYIRAIDAARRSIYIENQAIPITQVAARLEAALKRGVAVVVLVPADPEKHIRARRQLERKAPFDQIASLGRYEDFALVGIAQRNGRGGRSNIYVHSKIMLIDDAWATVGSCNLHGYSLFGNTEMNLSFFDPKVVHALRCELLDEHLGKDTARLDDRAALRLYRRIARENRAKLEAGEFDWQGLAFTLDPATYGE